MRDLWIEPKQQAVTRAVERWWVRWVVLAVLPAALVSEALGKGDRISDGRILANDTVDHRQSHGALYRFHNTNYRMMTIWMGRGLDRKLSDTRYRVTEKLELRSTSGSSYSYTMDFIILRR